MALAGLWERWTDPETQQEMLPRPLSSAPLDMDAEISLPHADDAGPKDFDPWLDGSAGLQVLKPAPEYALRERPVSRRANKPGEGDENPTLKEPVH